MVLNRLSLPKPMLASPGPKPMQPTAGIGWLPQTPSSPQLCRSVGSHGWPSRAPPPQVNGPQIGSSIAVAPVVGDDHGVMAERILARVDALVAEGVAARAAELGRHLIGEIVVGDEAHLALGVRRQDLARRAQLHAGAGAPADRAAWSPAARAAAGRRRATRRFPARRRRAARRLDPELDDLQLVEGQRRQSAERHRAQRRRPLIGQRRRGDVDPQQAVLLLRRPDAAQVRARRDAADRRVDEVVVRDAGGEIRGRPTALAPSWHNELVQPRRSKIALWISAKVLSNCCSHAARTGGAAPTKDELSGPE